MDRKELGKILKNPLSMVNLYNAVTLQFDDKSKFNKDDYSRFIFRNYWYILTSVATPEQVEKIGTFEEFRTKIINKGIYNSIYDRCEKILRTDTEWANVRRSTNEENIDGKIYLTVNNDQLYFLADELLKKIIQERILDYDFKVNCNPEISRKDGLTINFNKGNFEKYIKIIESIQRENPEILFKDPNCFAYRYDNFIGIGKDYKDGSSFTEKCCTVLKMLEGNHPEYLLSDIEKNINAHLKDLIELCEKVQDKGYDFDD